MWLVEKLKALSSGRAILKWTTPGSQLIRSMLQKSLKPITDKILLKIKGAEAIARKVSAPSLTS